MSMIIDRRLRFAAGTALALGLWATAMLAMPLLGPPGRLVAVPGAEQKALRQVIAAGGRLVDVRGGVVLARGGPGFAARLYRAGAPLVLEGRIAAGCFSAKAGA